MKIKKILSALLCLPLLLISSCSGGNNVEKKVAVIVKALDSDFWHSVKSGVDAAATEYNVNVTFWGPGSEEDYEAQNRLIDNAVRDGADAIVLSAIDYEKNAEAAERAMQAGTRVITIDSDIDSDGVSMFIGTDNVEAGRKAAEAAINSFGDGRQINIGIVNYYKSTENGMQREKGFRDYLKDTENANIAVSVNVSSNTESVSEAVSALLNEHPEINVLVGFNEWMTLGIGYTIKQLDLSDKVYAVGFDRNSVCIGMLETGEIDTLIVQNPFAIGYLGVKNAAKVISGETVFGREFYTESVAVNKENLFDADIQKLVFEFDKH